MEKHYTSGYLRALYLITCLSLLPEEIIAQQAVGIGTQSPAASAILDISSMQRGVLIPRMTTGQRESIDPADEGLMVYDSTRRMLYVATFDDNLGELGWKPLDAFWTENDHGIFYFNTIGIGTSAGSNEKLKVAADGNQIGIEVQNIASDQFAFPRYGIFATTANWNNDPLKSGGRFTAIGAGLKIGATGMALGDSINIGIHGFAEGVSAINRAAWFESGDVVIDHRLLVGSEDILEQPHPSALLELKSDSLGILFPRMLASQRLAIVDPAAGLVVYDSDSSDVFLYSPEGWQKLGTGGAGNLWSLHADGILYSGKIGVGTAEPHPFYTLSVAANGQPHAGRFDNQQTSNFGGLTTGVYATAANSGSNHKTGGLFEALNGSGRKTGIEAWAFGNSGENVGLYSYTVGSAPINRAAWFGSGDVVVEDRMLIGSSLITDVPEESALLELRSNGQGLLLPRMQASQRLAIVNPVQGLVVYDTDSSAVFLRTTGTWQKLGSGGGSGVSLWTEEASGIYFDDGTVRVGNVTDAESHISAQGAYRFGGKFISAYTAFLGNPIHKYGVWGEATSDGGGDKYGVHGTASTGTFFGNGYGVFGEAIQEGNSERNVYGIYGKVTGTGSGERWAGYFEGNAKVEDALHVGDELHVDNALHVGTELHVGNELHVGEGVIIYSDYQGTGDGRVTTNELQITGGSDLAEYFRYNVSGTNLTPGMVVSINPESNGEIRKSQRAYDRHVIGVVSGANGIKPGMFMGQQGTVADGNIPIAMVGRVYVYADESNGMIRPGDFLTSSDLPGYAMRVKNYRKAQGSILGKALMAADENGFVLMLVHLQ